MQNFAPQIEEANRRKGQILFAAEDIPMFHHFGYENISAFKIYYWSKAVLNSSEYSGQKYHYRLIHPEILKAVKTLHEAYNRIHSTEIWTDETINSTLRQIIYFKESGQFQDPKDALLLLDEFEQSMKDLEIKAEKSSKIPGEIKNNFSLYNCEVRIGNNCILLDLGDSRRVFLSHNTFNSLRTIDKAFCEETYNWLQNLVKKSTLISDIGEKQRFIFFKKVEDAISQARSVLS
jgi:hypothetical protein